MSKKVYLISGILVAIISVIFLFFDWKISTGTILGFLFSMGNLEIITRSYSKLGEVVPKDFVLWQFVRFLLLVVPLLLSFLLPNVFHYIGVVIGLTVYRLAMIFALKKGDK